MFNRAMSEGFPNMELVHYYTNLQKWGSNDTGELSYHYDRAHLGYAICINPRATIEQMGKLIKQKGFKASRVQKGFFYS